MKTLVLMPNNFGSPRYLMRIDQKPKSVRILTTQQKARALALTEENSTTIQTLLHARELAYELIGVPDNCKHHYTCTHCGHVLGTKYDTPPPVPLPKLKFNSLLKK